MDRGGDGGFALADESSLLFSLEQGSYELYLTAAEGAVVSGYDKREARANLAGARSGFKISDADLVDVEFYELAQKSIPKTTGILENAVKEEQKGAGGVYKKSFEWALELKHDRDQWWRDYVDLLEAQRGRRTEMWRDIQAKCSAGEVSGSPCRAADSALRNMDDWIARLGADCDRVLGKLLTAQCPGFAKGMRRQGRWDFEDAVCESPAATCEVVHNHLQDFFDSGPTGDVLVTYRRLPLHLHCLYTYEEFEKIAVITRPGFWSKALSG
jgi:hypothetical protein